MIFAPQAGFRYPIDPSPRTAVLVDWFGKRRFGWFRSTTRVFARGWSSQAASFAPAAIAATREQLLELAGTPPAVTHALIVLERKGDPMLSDTDRDCLWHAFRVPIFEQIIGPRGELLAAECEAHDGLHTETPGAAWNGYPIEQRACACGRETPRLVPAKSAEPARSVAAYAR